MGLAERLSQPSLQGWAPAAAGDPTWHAGVPFPPPRTRSPLVPLAADCPLALAPVPSPEPFPCEALELGGWAAPALLSPLG